MENTCIKAYRHRSSIKRLKLITRQFSEPRLTKCKRDEQEYKRKCVGPKATSTSCSSSTNTPWRYSVNSRPKEEREERRRALLQLDKKRKLDRHILGIVTQTRTGHGYFGEYYQTHNIQEPANCPFTDARAHSVRIPDARGVRRYNQRRSTRPPTSNSFRHKDRH